MCILSTSSVEYAKPPPWWALRIPAAAAHVLMESRYVLEKGGACGLPSQHGFVFHFADDRFAASTTPSSAHRCILPMYATRISCLTSS
jgi:hypothetical protein